MTSAEASSAVAVAGSVCDDQTHVAARLSDVADEDTPSDNKRPRLQDSTPDHQDVMGEENPDYSNEHRHYWGYAKVPTGWGMRHLYSPLGTLHWAPYNQQEHFFVAGKSEKWLRCIAAMKKCEECQPKQLPIHMWILAHCGKKLPVFQDNRPAKQCKTCKLTFAEVFNHCSKCGINLAMFPWRLFSIRSMLCLEWSLRLVDVNVFEFTDLLQRSFHCSWKHNWGGFFVSFVDIVSLGFSASPGIRRIMHSLQRS